MAMDPPERVSSRTQPKYVTLEYCFILMSVLSVNDFVFVVFKLILFYPHQNEPSNKTKRAQ